MGLDGHGQQRKAKKKTNPRRGDEASCEATYGDLSIHDQHHASSWQPGKMTIYLFQTRIATFDSGSRPEWHADSRQIEKTSDRPLR
jgi:hypothetical protein